jgi:tetratricopeptide (TPR) repeat protein
MSPDRWRAGVLILLLSGCSRGMGDIRRGERLYGAGSYRESHEAFQRALTASGDPALQYSVGKTLYRLHRYEEAARSFRDATSVPRLKQASYYNLGNSLVRAAEEITDKDELLRQAIAAYEEALRLNPADSAAKWNLEVALRRRGEDRESGGSPGRGRSADYGRGSMNRPGYEGNPEAAVGAMAGGGYGEGEGESVHELSQSEARDLVEAVERQQLNTHEGRNQPHLSGNQGDHDW